MVVYDITASGSHFTDAPATGASSTYAPPSGAHAVLLTVTTQAIYLTFDGSTPSATNGLTIPAGSAPIFLPMAETMKCRAATAGAVVNGVWLS